MRFRYYSLDQKGTLECERASEGGESNGSILRARCYWVVCRLFLALSMIPLASATDAQVRTPRDSPVIIHGRVQPSTSVDASRYLPTHIRPPDFIVKQVPSESIGITRVTGRYGLRVPTCGMALSRFGCQAIGCGSHAPLFKRRDRVHDHCRNHFQRGTTVPECIAPDAEQNRKLLRKGRWLCVEGLGVA